MIVCPTFHTAFFPYRLPQLPPTAPAPGVQQGRALHAETVAKASPLADLLRDLDEFKNLFFVVLFFWVGWIFDREYGIWMEYGIMNT